MLKKIRVIPALVALGLILAACLPVAQTANGRLKDENPNVDNGAQIYFSANSQRGGNITYTGGPITGGSMMGNYLTCASCHGPNAEGGRHTMHMTIMDAPDIRYVALSSESDAHEEMSGEYDLETFKKAVIEGQHPDGDALDINMPRWNMSDADLADLFAFLKSLS